MQFVMTSPDNSNVTTVASISKISGYPVIFTSAEFLNNLKMKHSQKIELTMGSSMDNSCYGVHQTIQSVKLAEDGSSALAQIGLPRDSLHENDTYYHVHPALLEGATF